MGDILDVLVAQDTTMNSPPLAKAPADRPSSTVAGGVTVDSSLLCNNKEFMELFISKESSGVSDSSLS